MCLPLRWATISTPPVRAWGSRKSPTDVRRTEKAFEGGKSYKPSVDCWELCGGTVGCIDGIKRRAYILLCSRFGSLYSPICNFVPETSDKWDNPRGAPSSFLSVCCSSKCCFYGMGKYSRFIWSWITDSLLHCPVPLFIIGESLPLKLPWAFLIGYISVMYILISYQLCEEDQTILLYLAA